MTEIRNITFGTAFADPAFEGLLCEYAEESSIAGLPAPKCQVEMYEHMGSLGILHTLGAYTDGVLVGFLTLIVSAPPHYGVLIATTESFFVGAACRKQGGGIKLLREAERLAVSLGAVGFLVSAPVGGRLAEVMPKAGYTETNRVFFRGFT